jgi:hypothetical protein
MLVPAIRGLAKSNLPHLPERKKKKKGKATDPKIKNKNKNKKNKSRSMHPVTQLIAEVNLKQRSVWFL